MATLYGTQGIKGQRNLDTERTLHWVYVEVGEEEFELPYVADWFEDAVDVVRPGFHPNDPAGVTDGVAWFLRNFEAVKFDDRAPNTVFDEAAKKWRAFYYLGKTLPVAEEELQKALTGVE